MVSSQTSNRTGIFIGSKMYSPKHWYIFGTLVIDGFKSFIVTIMQVAGAGPEFMFGVIDNGLVDQVGIKCFALHCIALIQSRSLVLLSTSASCSPILLFFLWKIYPILAKPSYRFVLIPRP